MGQAAAIAASPSPVTKTSLEHGLGGLGLDKGDTVLLHSSLSSLGWVCGGATAVLDALVAVLGAEGTVVVPAQTSDLSDPAHWRNPAVPEDWWPTIRAKMPAYRRDVTPSTGMGAIAELVRTSPGALRSDHPQVSFAALGAAATFVTTDHGLAYGLGETSPLARLYDLDAKVLLLGVGHDRNTSLHLAEQRAGVRQGRPASGPVLVKGGREWLTWDEIDWDPSAFAEIGAELERAGIARVGRVGQGAARLMPQRGAVDFAVSWLQRYT